ncbi:TPA: molecular chaperone GroEL, partial [Candidatus Saccharibacteria bacterium]|nr:molecular chaperone GroEL [Candidatus Saccharibacteria bacterium]
EKKFRVDDAVAATKAALEEGIVAGGGVTLVNLSDKLEANGSDSLAAGRSIVKKALLEPFRQLMLNAGLNADALLAQVQTAKAGHGVNVNSPEKLVDLKVAGVVDPAAVTRQAVQNAVSIAATAMTMGALVVDVPEEKPAVPDMGGMGM